MAVETISRPTTKLFGETVSLTTTAAHLLYRPTYQQALMYCASDWRCGLAPKLATVKYYNGSTYTDYTSQATDRDAATHVPLDAMTTAHTLYLGVTGATRGFYFNLDVTNLNAVAASLDFEYLYDTAKPGYLKITGTVSAALTVGETVTGQTSGVTATHVYDDGSTYIIVKNMSGGRFVIGEDIDGAAQTCDDITAIDPVTPGTGYFTDVGTDSDGTLTGTETLSQDGLYAFTLPAVTRGILTNLGGPLYWYRFTPSATLSATIDVIDLIPACDTTDYGYMQGGSVYQVSLNSEVNGAFEFDHTGTDTLNITWGRHLSV